MKYVRYLHIQPFFFVSFSRQRAASVWCQMCQTINEQLLRTQQQRQKRFVTFLKVVHVNGFVR